MNICALCGQKKNLQNSHLIPKFVYDYIKETSATGYLRQSINSNLRLQDGIKEKFLCKDCEQKFSKYESYFAENIFYPYLNKTKTSFTYNPNLKKFILSLSWRILRKYLDGFKKFQPEMYKYAVEAERYWRDVLLKNKKDSNYEHHLFLLNYISDAPKNLPEGFQFYTMRATDGTIASSKKEIYIFSKLPSMFFISSIYPKKLPRWENTLISENGVVGNYPPVCKHPGFYDFLCSRVSYLTDNPISKKQNDKISTTLLKNLDRLKNSKSFEVHHEEEKRRLKTN